MKKFHKYFIVIISLFIFINMTACSSNNNSSSTKNDKIQYTQEEIDRFKNDYKYQGSIEDNNVAIIKYKGNDSEVVIPNFVTRIGESAFEDCSSLTSIVIPNSVTSIGNVAFRGCSLQYNEYENCLYLGNEENPYLYLARMKDENVNNVTINPETKIIGEYAFSGCSSLQYNEYENCLYLGNEENPYLYLASIKDKNVNNVAINNKTKIIRDSAFKGCSSLTSIEIPDSVTIIGDEAFSGCSSLTSITIPDSVTSIELMTFSRCSSLTSIEIPDSATIIGAFAFFECSSLTSIEIPNSVTSIGFDAFYNCSSLTSIEIPNSVTSIGDSAFFGCRSLTSIEIPNSVTSIEDYAFSGCSSLENVYFNGTIEDLNNIIFYNAGSYLMYYAKHIYILDSNNEWIEVTDQIK